MMDGFDYLAHGGRYILVSLVMADIKFNDPEFHKRETTLLSSRNATREDFLWVMKCMKENRLLVNSMITDRCTFVQAPKCLKDWSIPGSGVIKAMVEL
jgi:threonine dehydrogenase-like Zn-dependent dehydrogenase